MQFPCDEKDSTVSEGIYVPVPCSESLTQWRTFISSCYHHPNLMAHKDVYCLRELFQKLGSDVRFDSTNILVSLGPSDNPTHYLQPRLHSNDVPPLFIFADVQEVEVVVHLNIAIIKKYRFIEAFKAAVLEMVTYVIHYPEVLLSEECLFIYDFLISFRVLAEKINNVITVTKSRRAEGVDPASVLVFENSTKAIADNIARKSVEFNDFPNETTAASTKESPSTCKPSRLKKDRKADVKLNGATDENSVDDSIEHSNSDAEGFEGEEEDEDGEGDGENKIKRRKKNYFKPFECPVCHSRFVYKGNANFHIRRKHPGADQLSVKRKRHPRPDGYIPPFSCPICNIGFVCKSNAKTHIKKFHPEDGIEPKASDSSYNSSENVKLELEDTTDSVSKLISPNSEEEETFSFSFLTDVM